ncbi:hypothetical protein [Salinisphaera aquimarina]|uniref:DUF3108 domain-containing protein n=1 Tax=Salinisphaera aquimarina TaxID=2094031 RepID=A0ABV7EQT7_9GAMM
MPTTMRLLAPAGLLALSFAAAPALAQGKASDSGDMRCFNGYAYTLQGDQYRYTEHHEQHLSGGNVTSWDVTYVGKGGDVIATKHMDFSANPTVPTYTLKIPADGYAEGIRHDGDRWTMFLKESADAQEQTKSFKIDPPMAADSGFNALVQKNFDTLEGGTTLPFKFVAAGRQGVINLKASKTGTTTFEGKEAVIFNAELDMFLVSHFVDSLKLTYDPDSKHLLEYRGIGNMHNAAGKVYPVRVTYASKMPQVASENGAPEASCGAVASGS